MAPKRTPRTGTTPVRARRSPARRSRSTRAGRRSSAESLVVYVHGIGRHAPSAELKLQWDLALFGSDRQQATRMAYWSDIVHSAAATRRLARATADADDDDLSVDDILAEAGISSDNAPAQAFVDSMLIELTGTGVIETPRTRPGTPRKAGTLLPGVIRRPVSRAFIKAFIADTAAYFFDAAARRQIRQRLLDALPPDAATPVTVVAHSQGSIIAAEVLAHLQRDLRIEKLVTIGSPLGLREVQDHLDVPPNAPHRARASTPAPNAPPFFVPAAVERWHNFADPLDLVAFDKTLMGDFVPHPDRSEDPPTLVDELIRNERTRVIGFNPHSAVGYLAHPKVRRSVYESAHFDEFGRFVVARDVAETLGIDARHPVLIEVLDPGYGALGEDRDETEKREREELKLAQAGRPESARWTQITLAERVERASKEVEALVRRLANANDRAPDRAYEEARIDRLRRFVAAHLRPDEIEAIAREHKDLTVYAIWRSAAKSKLTRESAAVVQADAARKSYGATGAGVTWAVLDTGIRSDHPHFNGRISEIWECTKPGAPEHLPSDRDRDGHGTHVAGIIAGQSDAAHQGIAPEARLVVYKVLNDKGQGEDAWIIKALDHIAMRNENAASLLVHGVNLSLGGPYDATVYGCGFTPICQELRRLWRSGVVVVVACGNEGQRKLQSDDGEVELNTPMSIGDPANLEDCIAVGSVSAKQPHLYGVSAFSSRGPTSDGRPKPDVVAPGERISSANSRFKANDTNTSYRADSGTSMAAPHVSGVLAAFLSVRREFRGRPDEVKRLMLDTCTDIGRDRHHQGRGIPNLMKMLLSV